MLSTLYNIQYTYYYYIFYIIYCETSIQQDMFIFLSVSDVNTYTYVNRFLIKKKVVLDYSVTLDFFDQMDQSIFSYLK